MEMARTFQPINFEKAGRISMPDKIRSLNKLKYNPENTPESDNSYKYGTEIK